jgi:hypothetical protein
VSDKQTARDVSEAGSEGVASSSTIAFGVPYARLLYDSRLQIVPPLIMLVTFTSTARTVSSDEH